MGSISIYRCADCGYESGRLLEGGGFRGARSVFVCAACRSLVAAQTMTRATKDDPLIDVQPRCPECDSTELAAPVRVGRVFKRVQCPRCAGRMRWSGAGIWD